MQLSHYFIRNAGLVGEVIAKIYHIFWHLSMEEKQHN